MYLVDTNVLLRFVDTSNQDHKAAQNVVLFVQQQGQKLCISSQNCVEFWNVMTRPKVNNGFGFSTSHAEQALEQVERLFTVITESAATYRQWRKLVIQYGVSGVQVHDARLVATMLVLRLRYILTFNSKDFVRYNPSGIIAIDPLQFRVEKNND